MRPSLPRLLFLLLPLVLACSKQQTFEGECTANSDCPSGFVCRGGLCACRADESCEDGQFCNMQGLCQTRPGCRSNSECDDDSKFCDISTGRCIDKTACGTDVHCPPGTVCSNSECVPGCYDDGDCPLYSICNRQAGSDPNTIGTCLTGQCGDKTFCPFGQQCVNGACVQPSDPNHCAPCNNQQGDCGGGGNFCLINSNYDPNNPNSGSQYFCGVECQSEQDCPNGYGCGPVVLLTQDQCTMDGDCGGGGRRCVIGEGNLRGACTCVSDMDCTIDQLPPTCVGSCGGLGIIPCIDDTQCATFCDLSNRTCQNPAGQPCTMDSQCQPLGLCADLGGGMQGCITNGSPCSDNSQCLCISGSCFGTGRPCSTGADCTLSCQGGGCLLGASCGPNEGLECNDLR